eukprot:CAMPEP_0201500888 /NCGR_PEP_ID=MMETSP0151_2-20130828/83298_1 /ASSEMBLY_ACC=CAM_ASM_000257 /TAXON_ID=200890 /ORGANISM="Paramoeba atlantica, Strain 621/1 / CCAP 1560/9" /LENGTH=542 /DNA_ID=CAMNT_0047894359 /DNA_START=336 /DNA_END=1965 /DNA_ORIENTATION=+
MSNFCPFPPCIGGKDDGTIGTGCYPEPYTGVVEDGFAVGATANYGPIECVENNPEKVSDCFLYVDMLIYSLIGTLNPQVLPPSPSPSPFPSSSPSPLPSPNPSASPSPSPNPIPSPNPSTSPSPSPSPSESPSPSPSPAPSESPSPSPSPSPSESPSPSPSPSPSESPSPSPSPGCPGFALYWNTFLCPEMPIQSDGANCFEESEDRVIFKCSGGDITEIDCLNATGCDECAGTIDSLIGCFGSLLDIYIPDSLISGDLPSEIGLLSLTRLVVANALLDSDLPSEIANLADLRIVDLQNNQITGNLPNGLWSLNSLETFDISNNKLTTMDNVSPSPAPGSVTFLDISENDISGVFATKFTDMDTTNLAALELLDTSHNSFTGAWLDAPFEDLPALSFLDVSFNTISGDFPQLGDRTGGSVFPISTVLNQLFINNNIFGSGCAETNCDFKRNAFQDYVNLTRVAMDNNSFAFVWDNSGGGNMNNLRSELPNMPQGFFTMTHNGITGADGAGNPDCNDLYLSDDSDRCPQSQGAGFTPCGGASC